MKLGYEEWRQRKLQLNNNIPTMQEAKQSPGGIIGLVHFSSVSKYELDPTLKSKGWAEKDSYCYVVDDFLKFDEVITIKGCQGVWYIHDLNLQKQIQEKLSQYLDAKHSDLKEGDCTDNDGESD